MDKINLMTVHLARASNGNPVLSTATIMLFYVMFNLVEASIEMLIFGERFVHYLDPIFALIFMGYAAYTVCICAAINSRD